MAVSMNIQNKAIKLVNVLTGAAFTNSYEPCSGYALLLFLYSCCVLFFNPTRMYITSRQGCSAADNCTDQSRCEYEYKWAVTADHHHGDFMRQYVIIR